jgi:hypothetical protein
MAQHNVAKAQCQHSFHTQKSRLRARRSLHLKQYQQPPPGSKNVVLPHSFWDKDGTKKDVLSLLLTKDVEVASFRAHGHTLRSDHLIACEKGVKEGTVPWSHPLACLCSDNYL